MGDAVDSVVFSVTCAGYAIVNYLPLLFDSLLGQDVNEPKTWISGVMQ